MNNFDRLNFNKKFDFNKISKDIYLSSKEINFQGFLVRNIVIRKKNRIKKKITTNRIPYAMYRFKIYK